MYELLVNIYMYKYTIFLINFFSKREITTSAQVVLKLCNYFEIPHGGTWYCSCCIKIQSNGAKQSGPLRLNFDVIYYINATDFRINRYYTL